MQAFGGVEVELQTSLTSALFGDESLASRSDWFTSEKGTTEANLLA